MIFDNPAEEIKFWLSFGYTLEEMLNCSLEYQCQRND